MGNTTSCAPSIIASSSGVKVLAPFKGTLKVYSKPIKASDLVSPQDSDRFFIADSTSLEIGHRVTSVPPTEFLRPRRELYLILPTDMLFSVLTHDELSLISRKAAETLTLHHNVTRYNHLRRMIFPVCMMPKARRTVKDDDDGDDDDDNSGDCEEIRSETLEEKLQEMKHGSWRPALETIAES
ncbi:PREDICTED: uncharacterized protein LOC104812173 [Tarenaya hassleriana]|uniref:uncharacterized protein LOC104812173 n=1 Tax=Tarenaya hassleriana TaxID=28532 RepID=UPI00053C5447|nr:PREDICTED: uncharacterized protein LOC104812173 [Tarenaya hassleriana]